MKKFVLPLLLLFCAVPVYARLVIGGPAPDFTLPDIRTGKTVSLSSFKGQVVVLQLMKCQ